MEGEKVLEKDRSGGCRCAELNPEHGQGYKGELFINLLNRLHVDAT
jgi:hypothetical protein